MNRILLQQRQPDHVNLIQLTDSHIFSNPDDEFDGIDTASSFQKVIKLARSISWPPDAILLTGDLVHFPELPAYKRLSEMVTDLKIPVFCIPGNHDDPALMRKALPNQYISLDKVLVFKHWTIIMLDSFLADTHAGFLHEQELAFLEVTLTEHQQENILICLHHPPVSVGSPWMDRMSLQNPQDFFAVTDRFRNVRCILWGHIHQEFDTTYKGTRLLSSPSTCVQFTPGTESYIKDNKPPGYRSLKLFGNGKLETDVFRVNPKN